MREDPERIWCTGAELHMLWEYTLTALTKTQTKSRTTT